MMLNSAKKRICPSCICRIWLNMRRQPDGEMKGIRPSMISTRAQAVQKVSLSTTRALPASCLIFSPAPPRAHCPGRS